MPSRLYRLYTLRNQMLFGFLLVMMIILSVVGIIMYDSVSNLLTDKAEKHIQQTAIQANGRLESILEQIDSLTKVVSTNRYLQSLLLGELNGIPATFTERQELPKIVNIVQTYSNGVKSVDLYNYQHKQLYPLSDGSLEDKVSTNQINLARDKKGSLIWFGVDPQDPESVIALRRISLIDDNFRTGGYLLVKIHRDVFAFREPLSSDGELETMILMGSEQNIIAANDESVAQAEAAAWLTTNTKTVAYNGQSYIVVRERSNVTGWTLLILTPIHAITEGISILRTAIFFSAGIGALLFLLLSFLLSTAITRPIFSLIKTMRATRLGVIKPTVHIPSTIEISELNRTYNKMVSDIHELIQLVYEKELLRSRTELKALQAQIHPHFLFNTLEALYWSLQDKEEEELAEFVVAMSDLFRYTIVGPKSEEWVSLREELDHIERYMLIMKFRFGERLSWHIHAPSAYNDVRVPKLILQPLVENAVMHGVQNKIGQGHVIITISPCSDENLAITVEDNGAGMDAHTLQLLRDSLKAGHMPSAKSGLGLVNVSRRINLYYEKELGQPGRLSVLSEAGAGTVIRMTIPAAIGGQI
jgi:two-component system sensor histidine kinase YesM